MSDGRLLTFEVANTVYALPIAGVLEVIEAAEIACVPMLDRGQGGAMNWHGDALPVVAPGLILEDGERPGTDSEHVLVLSEPGGESARLGLPIDRVLGLVDGPAPRPGGELVAERRPVEGRVVSVLDARSLLARAEKVIEAAAV